MAVGVDADTGLIHMLVTTAAKVGDVPQTYALLHVQEQEAYADAGHQVSEKRPENECKTLTSRVAIKRSKREALHNSRWGKLRDKIEKTKASIRAKVEDPFHVLKYSVPPSQGTVGRGSPPRCALDLRLAKSFRHGLLACGRGPTPHPALQWPVFPQSCPSSVKTRIATRTAAIRYAGGRRVRPVSKTGPAGLGRIQPDTLRDSRSPVDARDSRRSMME